MFSTTRRIWKQNRRNRRQWDSRHSSQNLTNFDEFWAVLASNFPIFAHFLAKSRIEHRCLFDAGIRHPGRDRNLTLYGTRAGTGHPHTGSVTGIRHMSRPVMDQSRDPKFAEERLVANK